MASAASVFFLSCDRVKSNASLTLSDCLQRMGWMLIKGSAFAMYCYLFLNSLRVWAPKTAICTIKFIYLSNSFFLPYLSLLILISLLAVGFIPLVISGLGFFSASTYFKLPVSIQSATPTAVKVRIGSSSAQK